MRGGGVTQSARIHPSPLSEWKHHRQGTFPHKPIWKRGEACPNAISIRSERYERFVGRYRFGLANAASSACF